VSLNVKNEMDYDSFHEILKITHELETSPDKCVLTHPAHIPVFKSCPAYILTLA